MISLPPSVRIFMARKPVDFRKAFDGLCAIVRDEFHDDPFNGHLFLFFNRRRDRLKILVWDRNGFWLLCKRLERGTFDVRVGEGIEPRVEVDRARLMMLLEGIDWREAKMRKHFASAIRLTARDDDRRSHPAASC